MTWNLPVGALLLTVCMCSAVTVHAQSQSSATLYSAFLEEQRTIQVELPRTYDITDRAYPVLYVLDAEWVFGYAKGVVDFMSGEIVGLAPEMIVVGVPNTNRIRDMWVTQDENDSYNQFLDFIEHELVEHFDSTYRTNGFNVIYGWSSGSAIASQFLFERPHVFDAFINSGSGIGPRGKRYAVEQLPGHDLSGKFFYADAEAGPREPGLNRLESMLDSLALPDLKYKVELIENETHLAVLASGVRRGLEFVFDDFNLTPELMGRSVEEIIAHFESLSAVYGDDVMMPEGAFVEAASLLEYSDRGDDAVALLVRGAEMYPYSSAIPGAVGELYYWRGDTGLAREHYEIALERASVHGASHVMRYETLLRDLEH